MSPFRRLSLLAVLLASIVTGVSARAEGTLIIGTQLEPPILDPTANPAAAISECLYANVYEGLVQFAPDGTVLPRLAQSWEVSDDGLVYLFHLIRGARFHDGAPFNAGAAKYTLDRINAAGSVNAQRSQVKAIRAVEVVDEDTVKITLSHRSGSLLEVLALGAFVMVSPQSAATNADHPVGTGPFRFLQWRRGDSLTLERNPDFRGRPAALDAVTCKFIADPTAAYAALMAGDIDGFSNYPAPESFAQFAADPRFTVFNGTTEMETILSLNQRIAPLSDVRVRRAIAYALDRQAIIDGAMFGYGVPIGSHFPPHNPAYIDLTGVYLHNIEKARALMHEAGYGGGFSMTLKLPPPSYARRGGEIVASQLRQIGITLRIENLEWAQWLSQVYARHEFDMTIIGHAEPLDYDIYARDNYYFGYDSADFKALIGTLEDTVDPGKRTELLRQVQVKLSEDAVNGFLFEYPRLDVWNSKIKNLNLDNLLGYVDFGRAHYEPGAVLRHNSTSHVAQQSRAVGLIGGMAAVLLFSAAAVLALRRFGAPYLLQRLCVLAATLLVATVVVFVVVQIIPGDPVRYMMGLQADPQAVEAMRHQLGLDTPLIERYFQWLAGLLRGDFGVSYTYRVPVGALILERLSVSLPLALLALSLSSLLAFPLGMLAAARRGTATDAALGGLTQLGLAIPNFWLGMLLVLMFAVSLHWVSAGGFPGWGSGFWPAVKALCLPALALAAPQAAILARVLRGALIDTLQEEYVRTARAKGADEWQVLWRHALPNALVPVLTILGMQFSFLLAGGVIIENVFFLPGLGRLVFQAITQRDLIVVQSVVVVLVFAVVCVTFLVDMTYALVNPQIREAYRA